MWDLIVSVPDHCLSFYCESVVGREWPSYHFSSLFLQRHLSPSSKNSRSGPSYWLQLKKVLMSSGIFFTVFSLMSHSCPQCRQNRHHLVPAAAKVLPGMCMWQLCGDANRRGESLLWESPGLLSVHTAGIYTVHIHITFEVVNTLCTLYNFLQRTSSRSVHCMLLYTSIQPWNEIACQEKFYYLLQKVMLNCYTQTN